MTKIPVTSKNVKEGLKVTKGRDWGYMNQGGDSKFGVIIEFSSDNGNCDWYIVKWENGYKDSYRVGNTELDKCDLYLFENSLIKEQHIRDVKKFFRLNRIDSVTREMLIENNLEKYLTYDKL